MSQNKPNYGFQMHKNRVMYRLFVLIIFIPFAIIGMINNLLDFGLGYKGEGKVISCEEKGYNTTDGIKTKNYMYTISYIHPKLGLSTSSIFKEKACLSGSIMPIIISRTQNEIYISDGNDYIRVFGPIVLIFILILIWVIFYKFDPGIFKEKEQ